MVHSWIKKTFPLFWILLIVWIFLGLVYRLRFWSISFIFWMNTGRWGSKFKPAFTSLDFCSTVHHQLGRVIQKNQTDTTIIYWSIKSSQRVSGILFPIIRSVWLRFLQHMVSCCCGGQGPGERQRGTLTISDFHWSFDDLLVLEFSFKLSVAIYLCFNRSSLFFVRDTWPNFSHAFFIVLPVFRCSCSQTLTKIRCSNM